MDLVRQHCPVMGRKQLIRTNCPLGAAAIYVTDSTNTIGCVFRGGG